MNRAGIIIAASALFATGCANTLHLTINCNPSRAIIHQSGGPDFGTCPASADYKITYQDRRNGYMTLKGLSAVWPSGQVASVSGITADLKLGTTQNFTFQGDLEKESAYYQRQLDTQAELNRQQGIQQKKDAREQIKREKLYAAKIKRQQLAADKATCRDYGIPKATKEFSACLVQVAQARQEQAQQQQMQQAQQAEQLQAQENERANQAAIVAAYNNCVNRGNVAASLCAFARSDALTCQLNAMANVVNTCKAQYGQ